MAKTKRISPIEIHDFKGKTGKYIVKWMAGNQYIQLAGSVQGLNDVRTTKRNILSLVNGLHGLIAPGQIKDYTKEQRFARDNFAVLPPKPRKRSKRKA